MPLVTPHLCASLIILCLAGIQWGWGGAAPVGQRLRSCEQEDGGSSGAGELHLQAENTSRSDKGLRIQGNEEKSLCLVICEVQTSKLLGIT